MQKYLWLFLLLIPIIAGCGGAKTASNPNMNWQVSPEFISQGVKLRGEQGRIAIQDKQLKAGVQQQTKLFFWGFEDEVTGKMVIIGQSKETGDKTRLVETYSIPAKPTAGASNSEDLLLYFPNKGLWQLQVFIDQQPFANLIVDVQ